MADSPPPRPLKIREVAEILAVSYGTVRSEIAAGRLRASRIRGTYRVDPADLAAYRKAAVIGVKAPRPKLPTGGPSAFKMLDGAKLLAAWREQDAKASGPPEARAESSRGKKSG